MTVQWRKSSYSGGSNDEFCVEVAEFSGAVKLRDSKDPDGGRLSVSRSAFAELLKAIKGAPSVRID